MDVASVVCAAFSPQHSMHDVASNTNRFIARSPWDLTGDHGCHTCRDEKRYNRIYARTMTPNCFTLHFYRSHASRGAYQDLYNQGVDVDIMNRSRCDNRICMKLNDTHELR